MRDPKDSICEDLSGLPLIPLRSTHSTEPTKLLIPRYLAEKEEVDRESESKFFHKLPGSNDLDEPTESEKGQYFLDAGDRYMDKAFDLQEVVSMSKDKGEDIIQLNVENKSPELMDKLPRQPPHYEVKVVEIDKPREEYLRELYNRD